MFYLTGYIDKQTLAAMALPRCGNVDVLGPEAVGRQKRYVLAGKYSSV